MGFLTLDLGREVENSKLQIRVAARASPLSRAQTDEALRLLRDALPTGTEFEVFHLDTPGDRDKRTPLSDPSIPDDFFTRDLDKVVQDGCCDLTVHSAKDLPKRTPAGLAVAALLPCRDSRDAVVLRPGVVSPADARSVGTSSPRRDAAVRTLCPAAVPRPLRGTIDERIAALDRDDFDAIVVAACALERLGLAGRIAAYVPGETTPLQGHLALVTRADDDRLVGALRPLDFRRHLFDAPASDPAAPAHAPVTPETTLFPGTHPEHFPSLGPLLPWPMIRLAPRPLEDRIALLERHLDGCASVAFASAFAARAFIHALLHARDARALAGRALFAVGPATADTLERLGFVADAVVNDFSGIASLAPRAAAVAAGRCLYPCSDASPTADRVRTLAAHGIELVPAVFYETAETCPGPLPDGPFGRVFFTSPSTVRSYFRHYPGERTAQRRWLAIGSSTLAALHAEGLNGEIADEPR